MQRFIYKEEEFKSIKKGDEVEVILKKVNKAVNGKVVENNLEQSYIRVDEVSTDTIIRYEQIKSVEIFNDD